MDVGKTLIILGLGIFMLGVVLYFSPKIPFLGKLPGDILIKKDGFTFYAPITTSIIISIILSIIAHFFLRK